MHGELMLIEKIEAENDYLRKCNVTLRQELAELKAKYEPEYAEIQKAIMPWAVKSHRADNLELTTTTEEEV